MATMLYKIGKSRKIWGIECDVKIFPDDHVNAALADGWVKNPLELKQKDEQKQPADANGDGKLSAEEARAYLDSIGVDYSGLHWKKVVALAEQHMKDE